MRPGDQLELSIEKAAAGGRMLARHEGQVVLVSGAIPGERVAARVERADRRVVFAETVAVVEASPDRRAPDGGPADLQCGGCLYAHIAYARQLDLKGEIVRDAFARLGRVPLEGEVPVVASPEHGYRMRARLHVRGRQAGFYREGSHDLCDARATRQLAESSLDAVQAAVESLAAAGQPVREVELAENMSGDQRILSVTPAGAALTGAALEEARRTAGLTGCTGRAPDGTFHAAGTPVVADPLAALTRGRTSGGALQRHADAFFQANRFILPDLVVAVLDAVAGQGPVIDLYAGVGLFSVCLAAVGGTDITAVEGDRASGADLKHNVAGAGGTIRVSISSVEEFLRRRKGRPAGTMILDPPRTGVSRAAMEIVVAHRARRIVYVSCDPPTMARDARRLLDGGYRLEGLRAFDLFPNTPHVETMGVFGLHADQ